VTAIVFCDLSPPLGQGTSAGWWKGLALGRSLARGMAPVRQPAVLPPPSPAEGELRHAELFAASRDATGVALALAFALDQVAPDQRPWLWVQDPAALRLSGRPYRPGLPPALRHRLLHVAAANPEDALFALEEGLRCRDLAFVIGELAGNPKALSFTASRRLSLVAEQHGVPLWLVRLDAAHDLSSARMRWEVRAAPSLPPRWNAAAPGTPAWQAELFRARTHPPGEWILRDDGPGLTAAPPDHGHLVAAAGNRSLAAG
jgi:protein ImuA